MADVRYVVKRGDTLWDLAKQHLGDPMRWPELHQYNNQPQVVSRSGSKIVDPDLIFVGQTIFLPASAGRPGPMPKPGPRPAPKPVRPPSPKPTPNAGKNRARPKVKSIPFKYHLPDLPAMTAVSPTMIATIKLKGSVVVQSTDAVDFVTLSQKGFEIKAKREADIAFGKLVSQNKVGYNPATGEVTFECGLTTHSNTPYSPSTTIAAGLGSTGLPSIKAKIHAPTIKGKVGKHVYVTSNLQIELELTPRPPTPKLIPIPNPSPRPVPVRQPQGPSGWDYLWGGLLVVGAGALIVATIVEDVATLGVGIADDPVSFAAASAMFVGGVALMQTVPGVEPIPIEGQGQQY